MTARTTTFSVTRDDIIKAALRKLGVLGEGEVPSAEDTTNCAFALNLLLKAMEVDSIYLWKLSDITLPLLSGTNSYQIGPTATGTGALVTDRPNRILDTCFVRDASNIDTPVAVITKQEYNRLSAKSTSSNVTQIYYDQQITNGVLKVYGTPSDSTHNLYLSCQIPIYDFSSGSEVLDIPQEGYQAVVYGLADEVMDEYPKPPAATMQRIVAKAAMYRMQLADFSQEDGSVFLQPNMQAYR